MSKKAKTTGKIIFVLLLVAAVCYTFRDSAVPIWNQLKKTAPLILIGICLSSVVYHLIEGWIICSFVRQYYPAFRYTWGVECAFYCSFYRVATLGSGAGIAAVYYLDRHGVEPSHGTGMYMIQYVIHKVSIAIFCGICFLLDYRFMRQNFGTYRVFLWAGYGITLAICVVLVLSVCSARFHRLLLLLLKKVDRKGKYADKIAHFKEYFEQLKTESVQLLQKKSLIVTVTVRNMVKLCFWYGIPYLILMESGQLGFLDSLAVTSLAVMLAAVIPTPAGIGSVEVLLAAFLSVLIGTGSAGAVTLLYRFATFIFPFLVGAVVAVCDRRKKSSFHF